jgi:hypothetical protein
MGLGLAARLNEDLGGSGTLSASFTITEAVSYCEELALAKTGELGASLGDRLRIELNKRFNWQDGKLIKDAITSAWQHGVVGAYRASVFLTGTGRWIAQLVSGALPALGAPPVRASAASHVVLAAGRVTARKASRKGITVRLTAAGRRRFRDQRVRRIKATVVLRLARHGRTRTVMRRPFVLRR